MFGKKLYKTTSINSVKVSLVLLMAGLLINLLLQTQGNTVFAKYGSFIDYYLFYPEDILIYLLFIFIPGVYFAFIRGVIFYEKGMAINRGLPFFEMKIEYERIQSFEIIHKKYLVAIKVKDIEEDIMFAVRDIDRAVAIFDQNHIKGDLGSNQAVDLSNRKKLLFFFILSGLFVFAWQHFGLTHYLIR